MKLSLRRTLPISRSPARLSATVLTAATLVALSLLLTGCNGQTEWTQAGYTVENYSSGSYVIYMTWASGFGHYLVVPPESTVEDRDDSDPVKAIVYDGSCLTTLTTVTVTGPFAAIYIDEAGRVFTSKSEGPLSSAERPNGGHWPVPLPSTCFGLHPQPTNS